MQVYLKQRLPAHCTQSCIVFLQFMVFQFSQPAISFSNSENKSKCSSVDLMYTHIKWNLSWHICVAIFVTASFKGKRVQQSFAFIAPALLIITLTLNLIHLVLNLNIGPLSQSECSLLSSSNQRRGGRRQTFYPKNLYKGVFRAQLSAWKIYNK